MDFNEDNVKPEYQLGPNTYKVQMSLHSEHRNKLIARMKAKHIPPHSIVLLEGGKSQCRYDTDHEMLFRQESFFHYLFGVKEPEFYGAIDIYSESSYLFIPRLPESYLVWMGKILSPAYYKKLYGVTDVFYVDEMETIFKDLMEASVLYTLLGKNTDSGQTCKEATFEGIQKFKVDNSLLYPELVECRVIKTPLEIDLMRYINRISSDAHVEVMKNVRPGLMEYQLESIFQHYIYTNGGCRNCSYTCICASGSNSSVLHYGHAAAANTRMVKDGDICMFDMGGEYHCYGADISRSFPANGKFTQKQREIYEIVLLAQENVFKLMKPGVSWKDMHRVADRTICEKLKEYGFIIGEVDELMANFIPSLFMPHGLGHLLGIDTHDVGGYPTGILKTMEPGLRSLRMGRVLEEGMILTVEPGVYFNPSTLEPLFEKEISRFLNKQKIREYFAFGGIRIEDDVVVTKDGIEILTTAPKTVEDIERVMASNK